jgi:UDP-N-acetyl-D-mannosaminuronic acid dehydrogenase
MVARSEREYDLSSMTVGILGMGYKAGSDGTRSSLSYKLKRLLRFRAARELCADPYVPDDPELWPLGDVLAESHLRLIATPHRDYAGLEVQVPVVDTWNLLGQGKRV